MREWMREKLSPLVALTAASFLPAYFFFKVSLTPPSPYLSMMYLLLMSFNYALMSFLMTSPKMSLLSLSCSFILAHVLATSLAKHPLELFFGHLSAELALWFHIVRNMTFFSIILSLPLSLLSSFVGLYLRSLVSLNKNAGTVLRIAWLMLVCIFTVSSALLVRSYNAYSRDLNSISLMDVKLSSFRVEDDKVLVRVRILNRGEGMLRVQTLIYDLLLGKKLINSTSEDFSYGLLEVKAGDYAERTIVLGIPDGFQSLPMEKLVLRLKIFLSTPFGLHQRLLYIPIAAERVDS